MSTGIQKKRPISEVTAAESSEAKPVKKAKAEQISFGRHFTELDKGDPQTFFEVADHVFNAVFEVIGSKSIFELLALASKHSVSVDKISTVWSNWKQATIGDRPKERDMPSWLNVAKAPKRKMEQEWQSLNGTKPDEAQEKFMNEVKEFAKDKEDLLVEMCTTGKVDLTKVRADIQARNTELVLVATAETKASVKLDRTEVV